MSFWRYIFSFLYARHPETGQWYVSMSRVYVFVSGIFLVLVALGIVWMLQMPIEYVKPNDTE